MKAGAAAVILLVWCLPLSHSRRTTAQERFAVAARWQVVVPPAAGERGTKGEDEDDDDEEGDKEDSGVINMS